MKIERETITTMTLEEFAEYHDLTMLVIEREKSSYREPFTACFKNCQADNLGDGLNIVGEGSSEKEALYDYANKLSCRTLCHDNDGTYLKIPVPVLTFSARGKACPPEPKAAKPVKTRRNSSPAQTAE